MDYSQHMSRICVCVKVFIYEMITSKKYEIDVKEINEFKDEGSFSLNYNVANQLVM